MLSMLSDDNGVADLYTECMQHYQEKQQKLTTRLRKKPKVSSSGLFVSVSGKHWPSSKKQNWIEEIWSIALFLPGLFCDSNRATSQISAPSPGRHRETRHMGKAISLTKEKRIVVDLPRSVIGAGFWNRTKLSNRTLRALQSTWVLNLGRFCKCGMARSLLLNSHLPFTGNLKSALWPGTRSNSTSAVTYWIAPLFVIILAFTCPAEPQNSDE